MSFCPFFFVFIYTVTAKVYTYLHTLSLHDALPISPFGQDEKPFLDTGERAVGDTHFCAPDFEVDLIWLLTVLANFRFERPTSGGPQKQIIGGAVDQSHRLGDRVSDLRKPVLEAGDFICGMRPAAAPPAFDGGLKSVVSGKGGLVRVDHGGLRIYKKK